MLLEDHEDLHELYISLHLQVEQMRFEPGPLLLTLMFLNYLLSFFFHFHLSFLGCPVWLHLHFGASALVSQLLRLKMTVILAIRCPLPASIPLPLWNPDCRKYLQSQHEVMSHTHLLCEEKRGETKSASPGDAETARTFQDSWKNYLKLLSNM